MFAGVAPAFAQGTSIKKMNGALDNILSPGAKIEKVAGGFIFVEGPMWKDGARLSLSDVRGDEVAGPSIPKPER